MNEHERFHGNGSSMPLIGDRREGNMKESTSTEDETIRRLVLEVAKALVDRSEDVQVDLTAEDAVITLRLKAAQSDVGKIIGKQGRTARSLRTIVNGAGIKLCKRYVLEILESQTTLPNQTC